MNFFTRNIDSEIFGPLVCEIYVPGRYYNAGFNLLKVFKFEFDKPLAPIFNPKLLLDLIFTSEAWAEGWAEIQLPMTMWIKSHPKYSSSTEIAALDFAIIEERRTFIELTRNDSLFFNSHLRLKLIEIVEAQ